MEKSDRKMEKSDRKMEKNDRKMEKRTLGARETAKKRCNKRKAA